MCWCKSPSPLLRGYAWLLSVPCFSTVPVRNLIVPDNEPGPSVGITYPRVVVAVVLENVILYEQKSVGSEMRIGPAHDFVTEGSSVPVRVMDDYAVSIR